MKKTSKYSSGKTSKLSLLKSTFLSSKQNSLVLIILLVWLLFQWLTKGVFLNTRNLSTLILQNTILSFVTLGMLVVLIVRGIDLSAGSVIAVISALGAVLIVDKKMDTTLVITIMFLSSIFYCIFSRIYCLSFCNPSLYRHISWPVTFTWIFLDYLRRRRACSCFSFY